MGVLRWFLIGHYRSPDGAKRNPGPADPLSKKPRISLALHPGYAGRALLSRRRLGAGAVALVDIVDHHRLEFSCDIGAAQGAEFLAVDEHRRRRGLSSPGQRDADVG